MPKVLLIFPPISLEERYSKKLDISAGGLQPPLGLAYIAAVLEQNSVNVDIISPIFSCILVPLFFSLFPVFAIRKIESGTRRMERTESCQLAQITIIVYIIARVLSLTISINPFETDSLTISISLVTIEERLPVLLLVKNPSERV